MPGKQVRYQPEKGALSVYGLCGMAGTSQGKESFPESAIEPLLSRRRMLANLFQDAQEFTETTLAGMD